MFQGWINVGVAFTTQFVAMGCTLYAFGVLLLPLGEQFGGRTGVTLALTAMSLSGAVVAPVVGRLVARRSLRHLMLLGSLALGGGFLLLSRATALWQLYLVFGTFFSFAANTLSGVTGAALVVNWFERRRGTALGVAQMGVSLSGMVMAPLATWLVSGWGWRGAYVVFGCAGLALAPGIWMLVVGRPGELDPGPEAPRANAGAPPPAPPPQLLREPGLWIVGAVSGLAFMVTTGLATHVVPFASDAGFSAMQAAGLLSAMAGAAAAGKPLFGALADRFGERRATAASLLVEAAGLAGLIAAGGYAPLLAAALLFGLGMGGMLPLSAALLARAFGPAAFGPSMGLVTAILIPFQVVGPPYAAWVFDATGRYDAAFWTFLAVLAVALGLLGLLRLPPRASR